MMRSVPPVPDGATGRSTPAVKLTAVKTVHTVIYLMMVAAILYVVYGGVVGDRGPLLVVAVALVVGEGVVFFANGRRCPLTTLAVRYGDPTGHVGDTFLPERCTRYTFRVFTSLFLAGLVLVAADLLGWR